MRGLNRRHALYVLAGLAALGAGVAMNLRRLAPRDPAEGALADFWTREFDTPSGARLATRSFQGRPLVVNFWATWCPPCVKEMPELDKFAQSAGPLGWQVLGVALDEAKAVQTFLQGLPVGFPQAIAGTDGLALIQALGNTSGGLPFTVVVSGEGRILHRKMGATSLDELQSWVHAS